MVQTRMAVTQFVNEMPAAFLDDMQKKVMIERKPLRYCTDRLANLLQVRIKHVRKSIIFQTLEISDDYSALALLAHFATLIGTYQLGCRPRSIGG